MWSGGCSPGDTFITEHRCGPLHPLGQQALEHLHAPAVMVFVGWDEYLWSECRSQLGSARFTAAFLLLLDQTRVFSFLLFSKERREFLGLCRMECYLLKAQHCWEAQCRMKLTCLEETPLPEMPQQEETASDVALEQPYALTLPILLCPEPKGVS